MSWEVLIYFQERGTKKEVSDFLMFSSRDEAVRALEKLEADLKTAGAEDTIVVQSNQGRISFIKQDYRRTKLYEVTSGPLLL